MAEDISYTSPVTEDWRSQYAVSSKEATGFIKLGGQNYPLFYAKKLEAKLEKNKKELTPLGQRFAGSKTLSCKGTGTLTIYEITSFYKEMFLDYALNGIDRYFDLQVINDDPTSPAGREVKVIKDCNFDSINFAYFDGEDNVLEQELPFTFEGVELLEKFKPISAESDE